MMKRSILHKKIGVLRSKGFSLVTVLSLGLVSTLMLFALSSSILPLYQKASQNVPYVQLHNASESAINLVVGDINRTLEQNQNSDFDDLIPGSPYTTKKYTPSGANAPTVTIVVKNEMPSSSANSKALFYTNSYDTSPAESSRPTNSSSFYSVNPYRIIEATAYFDVNAAPQVMARAIIRQTAPNPVQRLTDKNGPTSFLTSPSPNNRPVFNYAAFGINSLTLGPNTHVSGYDSTGVTVPKLAGDLGSNGAAKFIGGGIEIDGSLTVTSPTTNPYKTANVAQAITPPLIHDQLIVNGISDGESAFKGTDGKVALPGDTVLGESRSNTDDTFKPIITGANADTILLPPTPAAPTTAGSISPPTGGQKIVFKNDASYPPSVEALQTYQQGGTLNLPPGDYNVSSLSVGSDGSSIQVSSDVTQPVRIYVKNSASTTINLQNNGIQNLSNSPSSLQIYYSGQNQVTLNSNLKATVFAPNANIAIGQAGLGTTVNVFGAVVGSSVSTNNANLHFDSSLTDTVSLNNPNLPAPGRIAFDPSLYASASSSNATSYFQLLTEQVIKNPLP